MTEEEERVSISPFLDAIIMHSKIFGVSVGFRDEAGLPPRTVSFSWAEKVVITGLLSCCSFAHLADNIAVLGAVTTPDWSWNGSVARF